MQVSQNGYDEGIGIVGAYGSDVNGDVCVDRNGGGYGCGANISFIVDDVLISALILTWFFLPGGGIVFSITCRD